MNSDLRTDKHTKTCFVFVSHMREFKFVTAPESDLFQIPKNVKN